MAYPFDIKRFVDVNIVKHVSGARVGTRKTVVLFTSAGSSGTTRLITSKAEATTHYSTDSDTLAYLNVFFNCGGSSCKVIEDNGIASISADDILALDDEEIIVAVVSPTSDLSAAYSRIKGIRETLNATSSVYGANQKILLARTATYTDDDSIPFLAVKVTDSTDIVGAEMSIAAYLSQIDVYGNSTVSDYMFTPEPLREYTGMTDSIYEEIIDNNMNVTSYLANIERNLGGNLKDGDNLVNAYVLIILHQTLTEAVLDVLTQKVAGSTGMSKIYSAIVSELGSYLQNGYLSTDKVWRDNDLVVTSSSGNQYTVIEKNTAISKGYHVSVLPFDALTEQEIAQHKAPPIYVIIADQYGIRAVTINGEVLSI